MANQLVLTGFERRRGHVQDCYCRPEHLKFFHQLLADATSSSSNYNQLSRPGARYRWRRVQRFAVLDFVPLKSPEERCPAECDFGLKRQGPDYSSDREISLSFDGPALRLEENTGTRQEEGRDRMENGSFEDCKNNVKSQPHGASTGEKPVPWFWTNQGNSIRSS
jgi:hypothetical protein